MGNNYLLKSSLVFALLLVFCVKAMSQGPDNIPVEGSKFYQENGGDGQQQEFHPRRQRCPVDIHVCCRALF